MKRIRLTRGPDVFDMRGWPSFKAKADDTMKLPDGREVPKYVFHALESVAPGNDPALRGLAVEVTDEQALEALTQPFPTVFEEVTEEQAESDRYRRTLTRDYFGQWRDPATGVVVDPKAATSPQASLQAAHAQAALTGTGEADAKGGKKATANS